MYSFYLILLCFNMFTIAKWLNFCFFILTKTQLACQIKNMANRKKNIDYYIMKVRLVHLNTHDSSSLDKPDCVQYYYHIAFFPYNNNTIITMPDIF